MGSAALTQLLRDRAGRRAEATRVAAKETTDASEPEGRRPNIVVVLLDDLGYGEVGAYGQRQIATPRLDRLAREGLRFTDAYASAPVCAPSRCSLMTGLHSGHARVRTNLLMGAGTTALHEGDTTFAEVLRAAGYRTGLIGKWGFGPSEAGTPSHPNARGFEEFYGYMTHWHAHRYYPRYLWRDQRREMIPENRDAEAVYAPDRFRDEALDFIRRHRDEPFLLTLALNLPHAPSDVPDQGEYADRPWPEADRGHAAQITRLDGYVGDLVAELRAQGLERDTVLLVTSDNGPHAEAGVDPDLVDANGPLSGYKRNLFEGGIRVPLIAWGPGRIRPGTTGHITQQTDLLPTLAELAGAPAPHDVDGRSMASVLAGGTAPAQPYLYWYRLDNGNQPVAQAVEGGRLRQACEAVRKGRWKAIRWAPGRDRDVPDDACDVALYDLEDDLAERHDLAAERPGLAAALVRLMHASWVEDYVRAPYGLTVTGPRRLAPGRTVLITARLANGSASAWHSARLELRAPHGWSVDRLGDSGPRRVLPGAVATARWRVTAPAKGRAEDRSEATLAVIAEAGFGGVPLRFRREHTVTQP